MQETEQNTTRQTKYPYNRKQCNLMFRIQPQPNQKMYRQEQCQDVINNALDNMKKYGYKILQCKQNQISVKQKTMTRKVKLKFHCNNCNHPFTSIVGAFQIKFYQQKAYQQKRMDVYYQIKIYKMECRRCRSYCNPTIYQSQLRAVKHSFCSMLSEIMQNFQPPKHKDKRYKLNEDVHKHEERFCEACKLGKCHNIQKGSGMSYNQRNYEQEQSEQTKKNWRLDKQTNIIALKRKLQEQQQKNKEEFIKQQQLQKLKQKEQAKNSQNQKQIKNKPIQEKSQSFFTKLKRFFF